MPLEKLKKLAEEDVLVMLNWFQYAPVAIAISNENGEIEFINHHWEVILGRDNRDMQNFMSFVHPDDRNSTRVRALTKEDGTSVFINRYRNIDGEYVWLRWHISPLVRGRYYNYVEVLNPDDGISQKEICEQLAKERSEFPTTVSENFPDDHASPTRYVGDDLWSRYEELVIDALTSLDFRIESLEKRMDDLGLSNSEDGSDIPDP